MGATFAAWLMLRAIWEGWRETSIRSTDPALRKGPGELLVEELSGANGIGMPLAGGRARRVRPAGSLLIGGFRVFTCQGLPIRAPDGSVAGDLAPGQDRGPMRGR